MRALMYLLTVLAVMGLAFWAYRENYRTQAAIDEMNGIQNEIAGLREQRAIRVGRPLFSFDAPIDQPTPHGRPNRIGAFQIKISRRQVKPRQNRARRRLIGQ